MRRTIIAIAAVAVAIGAAYAALGPRKGSDAPALAQSSPAQPPAQTRAPGPGVAPRISVATAVAVSRDMTIVQRAVGWVEPIATVVIKPRIDGVITEQTVHDGQIVKVGDPLFRLDDRTIRAQIAKDEAQILKDQAMLTQATAEAGRAKGLFERSVGTQQQADLTAANAKAAAAAVQADRATLESDQVQLSYTVIRAPIPGRVGVVNTSVGNYVRAADANGLLSIVQMAPVRVSFSVPERELDAFREALARPEGTPVKVLVAGDRKERATGRLNFIDNAVDNVTGTFTAKAEMPNENGALWPGQYISAFVELGLRKGVTVVPLVAVQEGPNGAYVFLVRPNQSVEMRKVDLIETRGQEAAIASGVVPGDHVVVEGQAALRDGSFIRETVTGEAATTRVGEAGPPAAQNPASGAGRPERMQ